MQGLKVALEAEARPRCGRSAEGTARQREMLDSREQLRRRKAALRGRLDAPRSEVRRHEARSPERRPSVHNAGECAWPACLSMPDRGHFLAPGGVSTGRFIAISGRRAVSE